MPSFTPYKSVNSPALRFNRAPNIYLLKDGSIVEGGSPHEDLIDRVFFFGHEPSGVSDAQARRLLDYGFDLIPDAPMWHEFKPPFMGSSFGLIVGVNQGPFARGVRDFFGADAHFTVWCGVEKIVEREIPWLKNVDKLQFSYVLDRVQSHRVEVVLRNKSFQTDPYVAEWNV